MSGTVQPPPTATAQVSAGQAPTIPVSLGYYPQEGSRSVSAAYNWGTQTGYNEDLSQLSARGMETTIQGIYIDNSTNPAPVTLLLNGSGQVIVCPGNAQGVFPALFSGMQGYQISVPALQAATAVTRLWLVNVPFQSASVWGGPGTTGVVLGQVLAIPEQVAGTDAGLSLDNFGALFVNQEVSAPTYSAAGIIAVQAAATDFFSIAANSGGKTIRVHEIRLTTSAAAVFGLNMRNTAPTGGGGSVNLSDVPHDRSFAAAVALVQAWTINPTNPGTLIGLVEALDIAAASAVPITLDYGVTDCSLVLRLNQTLTVGIIGAGNAALTVGVKVKWSEV